jgi:hypothetical protein
MCAGLCCAGASTHCGVVCRAVLCCAVLCCAVLCSFYGESIPGNVLCERIASYKHLFNLYWYTR